MEVMNFIASHEMYFVAGILLFFGLLEVASGLIARSERTKDDVLVESISTIVLMAFTKPVVMLLAFQMTKFALPSAQSFLGSLNFWIALVLYLLIDDVLQYWYHRLAHEHKWLWKHHRPHHAATEMGFLVSYRETIFYFMLMPNVWWLGIATYFGLGIPVAVGLVLKQLVVISSHSAVPWDQFFYRRPRLMPILRVLERIIITPAFHHGHHAVSKIDGIGQPNANFGNMFSFWDQIFGTATFTHAFPSSYGLPNDPKDSWASHTFYPLIKSEKEGSEISKDYDFKKTTLLEPAVLTLTPGDYLYCTCGYSKDQPFCDGSHHGTKFQPTRFTIRKEMEYKLCQCKACAKGPFCDDSHLKLR